MKINSKRGIQETLLTVGLALLTLPLFWSCQVWAETETEESVAKLKEGYVRPKSIPYPENNAYSKDREQLGKMIFFDPRISRSNVMSCATCHNPSLSWGDGLPKAVGHGHKTLGRRSPSIMNLAWAPKLFWDGRAGSLEEQALGPMFAPGEMAGSESDLMKVVTGIEEYKKYFEKAYPGEPLSPAVVAKAVATYERGIISGVSPFDRWIKGNAKAISVSAQRGFKLFNTKANCASCHSGWSFTDHGFYDIGVADDDIGRGKVLPFKMMQHAFKTPTLRNIAERGPYLHSGEEGTLEEVVEFYNQGGKAKRPSLSEKIKPLNLTQAEKTDLIEFLKTLSSVEKSVELPVLPRFVQNR